MRIFEQFLLAVDKRQCDGVHLLIRACESYGNGFVKKTITHSLLAFLIELWSICLRTFLPQTNKNRPLLPWTNEPMIIWEHCFLLRFLGFRFFFVTLCIVHAFLNDFHARELNVWRKPNYVKTLITVPLFSRSFGAHWKVRTISTKRWLTGHTDDAYGLSICEIQYVQWCWTPIFIHFPFLSVEVGKRKNWKQTHAHNGKRCWRWWQWLRETRKSTKEQKTRTLVYLIRGARRREKAKGIEKAGVYQYFFKMISSAILLMFNVWSLISRFNFFSWSFYPLRTNIFESKNQKWE